MANKFKEDDLHELIWGNRPNISEDVFKRWCQGFEFSSLESIAIKQHNGGPCSILASVQAHIFKFLFFEDINNQNDPHVVLLEVLKEMLILVSKRNYFVIVYVDDNFDHNFDMQENNSTSFTSFIASLRYTTVESEEDLEAFLLSVQPILYSHYGIICFLYSIVLTYGVDELKSAMCDEAICLIDPMHGHSSQCLTNLLITGRASPYLFDNDKDLGGYVISGIANQPKIGFLTIMEYLHYCEVGWNLKNPQYPIWVLASETHLTVLCSKDKNVIEKENNVLKKAEKNFNKIDTNDQGFIMPEQVKDFLTSLNFPSDEDFVTNLTKEVDPENLGLFLKSNILKYLYPQEVESSQACYKFPIIHYNGLVASNKIRDIQYCVGEASVDDFTVQTKDYNVNDSQLLKCLRTKWPTITIKWEEGCEEPSLN